MNFNIKSGHKGFVVIMFIGLILLSAAVIYNIVTDGKINHWTHTEAKVVGYKEEYKDNSDGERELMYREILEYTAGGIKYEEEGMSLSNIPPLTGVSKKIAYNPDNPKDFIEIQDSKTVKILLYVIGGILSLAGLGMFLASCRMRLTATEE